MKDPFDAMRERKGVALWTEQEKLYLYQFHKTKSLIVMAKHLGRTEEAVRKQCQKQMLSCSIHIQEK